MYCHITNKEFDTAQGIMGKRLIFEKTDNDTYTIKDKEGVGTLQSNTVIKRKQKSSGFSFFFMKDIVSETDQELEYRAKLEYLAKFKEISSRYKFSD